MIQPDKIKGDTMKIIFTVVDCCFNCPMCFQVTDKKFYCETENSDGPKPIPFEVIEKRGIADFCKLDDVDDDL